MQENSLILLNSSTPFIKSLSFFLFRGGNVYANNKNLRVWKMALNRSCAPVYSFIYCRESPFPSFLFACLLPLCLLSLCIFFFFLSLSLLWSCYCSLVQVFLDSPSSSIHFFSPPTYLILIILSIIVLSRLSYTHQNYPIQTDGVEIIEIIYG